MADSRPQQMTELEASVIAAAQGLINVLTTDRMRSRFFLSQTHHLRTLTKSPEIVASLQGMLNYSTDSCVLREGSVSMADMSSDDDVLQWLASQVDASKDFKICITQDNLIQRGLIQWQRQKKGSPVNKLNVTLIGEAGIDTGALSKDFLTGNLTKDDVDDLEYALLIERVEAATDLTQLTDEIVSCGYTGLLKMDRKDSIIRAIVLHATMHLTPMLKQIRNGMKIYNLLDVIGKHQTLCSNLFVPKEDDDRPELTRLARDLPPRRGPVSRCEPLTTSPLS
ncbi:hypothetical protein ABVT39_019977 [Epinephelus coioides]